MDDVKVTSKQLFFSQQTKVEEEENDGDDEN